MLFRPYLAGVGVAAIVVLSAAVPAVAASPTTTSPVAAPTSAPTTAAAPTKDLPKACPFILKIKDGKRELVKVAASGKAADARIVAACRAQLSGKLGIPKGAPETGGGGMAAEVSSWS